MTPARRVHTGPVTGTGTSAMPDLTYRVATVGVLCIHARGAPEPLGDVPVLRARVRLVKGERGEGEGETESQRNDCASTAPQLAPRKGCAWHKACESTSIELLKHAEETEFARRHNPTGSSTPARAPRYMRMCSVVIHWMRPSACPLLGERPREGTLAPPHHGSIRLLGVDQSSVAATVDSFFANLAPRPVTLPALGSAHPVLTPTLLPPPSLPLPPLSPDKVQVCSVLHVCRRMRGQ